MKKFVSLMLALAMLMSLFACGNGDSAASAIGAFNRMEAKADEMLDRANAMAELSSRPADPAAELEKKYEEAGSTAAVDDELSRMKAEMGLQ